MRNFSKHSRKYPTLARDIIAMNGFGAESDELWRAWKDAVLDLACDASDQSHLLVLIRRAMATFCAAKEGSRAVDILADLARIVPSSLEIIMKHFEASFPYWKTPQSTLQLQNFTQNALNLGTEQPQLLERIIDFLTRKILLIDLSIRSEDVALLSSASEGISIKSAEEEDNSESFSHVSGLGERYSQEEKARELEENQLAIQQHLEQVRDYTNKIDSMLKTLFDFIEAAKVKGNAREIGLFILISFERNVLHSTKPKFVQFLMFYVAGIDNFVADRLLGSLITCLFARDAQLSTNTPKSMNNTPAKAKVIRHANSFLLSFIKKSTCLTETQLKTVNELLLEWIGRKVEALTLFPQNKTQIEISILAMVIETHLEIAAGIDASFEDERLKQGIHLATGAFSPNLHANPFYGKLFENSPPVPVEETSMNQNQKQVFLPFNSLPLPLCGHFLSNSGTFRE